MVAPWVNDKRVDEATGERRRFASAILPPWCRKSPTINEVLPLLLYLHGLSTQDFVPALGQFLGSGAGLSAAVVTRLTAQWQDEAKAFNDRDLSAVDYVYLWADGVHAERTIRYVTKYITKQTGDCHKIETDRQRRHLDRLWQQLQLTPCTDRCPNWLLYGVQPKKAHAKLKPGRCKGKVHQRETLGIGGRRVLISREWSGKTLADHKHDARAWVRALLGVTTDLAGVDDQVDIVEPVRHAWELARPDDPDVPPLAHRLMRSISERARWRAELLAAKDRAAHGPPNLSATDNDATTNGEEEAQWTRC